MSISKEKKSRLVTRHGNDGPRLRRNEAKSGRNGSEGLEYKQLKTGDASEIRKFESPDERKRYQCGLGMCADQLTSRSQIPRVRVDRSLLSCAIKLTAATCKNESSVFQEKSYQNYRKFFDLLDCFDVIMRKISDKVYLICWKLCSESQTQSVSKINSVMFTEDFPVEIICCDKCSSIIKNDKTSTAHWNDFSLESIPLDSRNAGRMDMDLKLVLKLTPTVKINKRRGGSVEQSGKPAEHTTSTNLRKYPIVESTQDKFPETGKHYIDVDKLTPALEQIVEGDQFNGQLETDRKNDVLITSNGNMATSFSSVLEENNNKGSHFDYLGDGVYILRGSFHQGSFCFGEDTRGRQCTANSTAAIAYSIFKHIPTWTASDLDEILLAGNAYYEECLQVFYTKPNYLSTDELLPSITITGLNVTLQIEVDAVIGVNKHTDPSSVPQVFFTTLCSGLEHFFRHHSSGILTCETEISVAIFQVGGLYYLFDSHSRGPKGFIAGERGTAMMMRFDTLEGLSGHLQMILRLKTSNNLQYSITAITPKLGNIF